MDNREMTPAIKKNITVFLLLVWVALWCNFILRDLLVAGKLYNYIELIGRDTEGKHARAYGEEFYKFLKSAKAAMPLGTSYGLIGTEKLSLAHRRAVYYLYPLIEGDSPDYILDAGRLSLKKIQ